MFSKQKLCALKSRKMSKFTLKCYLLWVVTLVTSLQPCSTIREISGLLDEDKDLTNAEISALRPLFEELQLQYDFISGQKTEKSPLTEQPFKQQYEATLLEFEKQLSTIFPQVVTTTYNTALPTLEDIMGKHDLSLMSQEQRLEFLDIQGILQDTLDETEINLKELVAQTLKLENELLKINIPKIATLIFKALLKGYKAASRIGRAAYCTYSQLPQLNTSLHSLYEGADCYLYTTSLITKIQNETYQTVKTVRKNMFELAAVYKKVTKQNTLMGKIITIIMNVTKIARDVLETIQLTRHVLDGVENQLPAAAEEVAYCSSNVAPKVPFVFQTVTNVTECILFKDETAIKYDFLKSEEDYNQEFYTFLTDALEDEEEEDDKDRQA